MKSNSLYCLGAAVLGLAWLLSPVRTEAAKSYNLSIDNGGNAESCADLKVRSDGEVVQAAESLILSKSQAPTLEVAALEQGVVKVIGGNRLDYGVDICKIAVADTRANAEQVMGGISVSRMAGRFSTAGPHGDGNQWQVYFIVHAPKDGNLDIETVNGPVSVRDLSGNLKLRATNGPLSISNCGGFVDAHTVNGPISFSGGGGDVRLNAQNGPISLSLAGDMWNGSRLEARTVNGPLSVNMAETFRSGVRLETDGKAPLNCRLAACRNAQADVSGNRRVIQLNGSQDTVRLSTRNGPVSVSGGRKTQEVI